VAVEASYTIESSDVQRAVRRAEILKKAADRKVLPAVVGYRIAKDAKKLLTKEEWFPTEEDFPKECPYRNSPSA